MSEKSRSDRPPSDKPPKKTKPPETAQEKEQRELINRLADYVLALIKANKLYVSEAIWQTLTNHSIINEPERTKKFKMIKSILHKREVIGGNTLKQDDDDYMKEWPHSKRLYAKYMRDAQKKLDALVEQIHGPQNDVDSETKWDREQEF